MSAEQINRFDRIVAILIQLQSKRIVKAQELADRFDISLRTVYRDIRSLEASGVPIISEAGVGYSIMDGYRLPPVMFTKEEAGSFVAAEKLMKKFTDESLGGHYEAAMFKIKSVLRGAEKEWVDSLDAQIQIQSSGTSFNSNVPNALEVVMNGIAEKRRLALVYKGFENHTETERVIEPLGLFNENNQWYISAYCLLRKDYRHFRADRILAIRQLSEVFEKEHGVVQLQLNVEDTAPKIKVRIRVTQSTAKFLQHERKYFGFVEEVHDGDFVEMTFMVNSPGKSFARWFLMFAEDAVILEPESVKENVREILSRIQID